MHFLTPKYSHNQEINERLSFLHEFAKESDFQISKAQLKVIYGLMTQSPIKSDFTTFLTWCNTACKAQSVLVKVLDLEEVGEFFSELISTQSINLAELPVVGFDFLTQYFVSQNHAERKLIKIPPPEKKIKSTTNSGWYSTTTYGGNNDKDDEVEPEEDDATFTVTVNPSELTKIDMIWTLARECHQPDVIRKAISFLVNCYISVNESIEDQRVQILQSLITRCFELITASQDSQDKIKRLILILESVIQISEKKGTGGVQPHNAILKGEMLDRIIIRYMVKQKNWYGSKKLDRTVIVKLFTSATVWEFKKEVSAMIGLSPKYIKLTLPNKKILVNSMHGMTLQQLGIKNNDILTAEKLSIPEVIPEAPLCDLRARELVPRAKEIFAEWYDKYKNKTTGLMDNAAISRFIYGSTKSSCPPED